MGYFTTSQLFSIIFCSSSDFSTSFLVNLIDSGSDGDHGRCFAAILSSFLGSVLNSKSITPYYTPTILTIFIMVVMHLIVSLSILNRTKKKIR